VSYRENLKQWVLDAIDAHGGATSLMTIAKHIWDNHEKDLRSYGERFYTWQYDMRWAAQYLRNNGILESADKVSRGIWQRRGAS